MVRQPGDFPGEVALEGQSDNDPLVSHGCAGVQDGPWRGKNDLVELHVVLQKHLEDRIAPEKQQLQGNLGE